VAQLLTDKESAIADQIIGSIEVDGQHLVLKPTKSDRLVRVFRPLGRLADEPLLKAQLAALKEPPVIDVVSLLTDLDGDMETRERASRVLMERGVHHVDRIERALSSAKGEAKARLEEIVASLREVAALK
jgi:hypothetical protein